MIDQSKTNAGVSQLDSDDAISAEAATEIDINRLVKSLVAFREPSASRSWYELAATFLPLIIALAIMMFGVATGYYFTLLLTPLTGLLLLRMFIIQHDCGHGAFMPGKKRNDWIGRAIGVLTLTPYDCWRRSHELHHAGTGNLDARGFGDVDTLTVREFQSLSPLKRFGYRVYRHPMTILGFGPAYLFLLRHRLPIGLMKAGSRYWISAMVTNAVAGVLLVASAWLFGLGTTLLVFLPTLLLAATVGIHHIHHLMSRIPFYRLYEALGAHPELANVNRITPRQTIRPFLLVLWDEDQRKMVRFRDI